ncbi:hypothetical protein N752_16440 [Desulforamulus aquiferis]|nr:hypothetical protein N752_16440 [Desulforamulus aquiferis]
MHHIKVASYYGVPVVVSINRFTPDTDPEVALVREKAMEAGALGAYPITVWADGGEGAVELAEAVVAACEKPSDFQLLYPDNISIKEKIETLAKRVYNADGVVYEPWPNEKLSNLRNWDLADSLFVWRRLTFPLAMTPV